MEISPDQLRRASSRFRKLDEARELAREERNRLIRQALAEGWTHQAISDATGVSRGRISQMVEPRDGAGVKLAST